MKSKFLLAFLLMTSVIFAETVKMKDTPIKSRISFKQLNRISVKNDRIESISGLDVAFTFEKNEKTGDGYIRPTQENGHEPIAISLTTVSGKVQEIVFDVDDGAPNILILENGDQISDEFSDESEDSGFGSESVSSASSDYETAVTTCMKKLITEENIIPINLSIRPVKKVSGFCIKFLEGYKVGGFIGYKFKVSNESNVMTELKESDFWTEDDVALSFDNLRICKGNPLILYVLVRA